MTNKVYRLRYIVIGHLGVGYTLQASHVDTGMSVERIKQFQTSRERHYINVHGLLKSSIKLDKISL